MEGGGFDCEQKKGRVESEGRVDAIARHRSRQQMKPPRNSKSVSNASGKVLRFVPNVSRFVTYIGFGGDAGGEAERREGQEETRRMHCKKLSSFSLNAKEGVRKADDEDDEEKKIPSLFLFLFSCCFFYKVKS